MASCSNLQCNIRILANQSFYVALIASSFDPVQHLVRGGGGGGGGKAAFRKKQNGYPGGYPYDHPMYWNRTFLAFLNLHIY